MLSSSLSMTVKVCALLLLIAAGALLSGPAGFGPGKQSAAAALRSEVKKLLASDGQADDNFGWSVAISGDTAVLGARWEHAGDSYAGAAYVFQRDQGGAGNWGEVKKVTGSNAVEFGDNFGFSVAISGDTVVVGTPYGPSEAYVFERNEGGADNWGEVTKLTASDAQTGVNFGISVAVRDDTIVVGARRERVGGTKGGAAYIFGRDQGGEGNWGEVNKLTASDAQDWDWFGSSVAVTGDTLVVGAPFEDAWGSQAGAAYVFRRDTGGAGNWGQLAKVTASDAQTKDYFGWSVAVSGDTVLVGAPYGDAGDTGATYIFQPDQDSADTWSEVEKLTASDAELFDHFGGSVAISGDTAFVGARNEDAGGNRAGAAYLFRRDEGGPGNWGEVTKLTASDAQADEQFGVSVALGGEAAVVGATDQELVGDRKGSAYVFEQQFCADFNRDGVITVRDLVLLARHMGSSVGDRRYDSTFDINEDGAINNIDLMMIVGHFGETCP